MLETQKITAHIPIGLLKSAQAATGENITETIKIGLEKIAQQHACEQLLKLRGKVKLSIDLKELRKDREIRLPPLKKSKKPKK